MKQWNLQRGPDAGAQRCSVGVASWSKRSVAAGAGNASQLQGLVDVQVED